MVAFADQIRRLVPQHLRSSRVHEGGNALGIESENAFIGELQQQTGLLFSAFQCLFGFDSLGHIMGDTHATQ